VVTEDADESQNRYAVHTEEEAYFLILREEILKSLASCRPFWLVDRNQPLLQPDEAAQVVVRYNSLASRTACHDPADKVRALCPLLVNVPVEDHKELMELVAEIMTQARTGSAGLTDESMFSSLANFTKQISLASSQDQEASEQRLGSPVCVSSAWSP